MDFLQMVRRGVRFDRKRFSKDIKVFEKTTQKSVTSSSSDDVLDFFGNKSQGQDTKKSFQEPDGDEEEDEYECSSDDVLANEDGKAGDDSELVEPETQLLRHKARHMRKEHKIHIQGTDVPQPLETFDKFEQAGVPSYLIRNLKAPVPNGEGYTSPTPIQMQSIPIMLKARELLACAPTGSGKTAAFIVPALTMLQNPGKKSLIRCLVLSPTKELADQIFRHFKIIAQGRKWKVFVLNKSNANANTFSSSSSGKKDVLVATPMRLVHLLQQGNIDLSGVEHLILDEADRLFELGFVEQVDQILEACPKNMKRSMFSATMQQGVEMLAKTVMHDPIRVTVGAKNAANVRIKQDLIFTGTEDGKLLAFRNLMQKGLELPVLVFVQSKERATQLFHELVYDNINVDVIHAERTPGQRATIITKFRSGQIWVLICTDLMSRGIDFKGVNCVVNYDFPQSTVSYIHRIGRTGRAGREGHAVTFFTDQDTVLLRSIADVMKASGCQVPDWIFSLNHNPKARRKLAEQAPQRMPISTQTRDSRKSKLKNSKRKVPPAKKGGGSDDGSGSGEKKKLSRKQQKKKRKYGTQPVVLD